MGETSFSLEPGRVVAAGRYRLVGELGRGGFGIVYRAEQLALGREVALKLLTPTLRDPEKALQRFRREAELAQRLEHPNTVRIYDFGQLETGHWFIALELLRGMPLDAVLARGPLSPARTARVATQILKSMMEAHARGVVHRDLKPQNIFLCDFSGETDFVKVLDFGVAKVHGEDEGKPVTHGGQIVGTPAYMAPEQVTGGAVTPATDLYALGLVVAECLTARPVVGDLPAIQACMLQASPAPLAFAPEIAMSAFGPIIVRATKKDPAARYRSADEMLHDVERLLSLGSNDTALATLAIPRASLPAATQPMPAPLATSLLPPNDVRSAPPAPLAQAFPAHSAVMNVAQPTLSQPAQPNAVVMTRGAFATLLVLGGLLLVGTAAGSAFYISTRDRRDATHDATHHDLALADAGMLDAGADAAAPEAAIDDSATAGSSLATFTLAAARKRLEKHGFALERTATSETPGYRTETFMYRLGTDMVGVVQFLEYDSEAMLEYVMGLTRKQGNAAFVHEGHRLLVVYARNREEAERHLRVALGP